MIDIRYNNMPAPSRAMAVAGLIRCPGCGELRDPANVTEGREAEWYLFCEGCRNPRSERDPEEPTRDTVRPDAG